MTKHEKLKAAQQERLETANEVIKVIASHGRRFFSALEDKRPGTLVPRTSEFFFHKGCLWFKDKWTQKHIFVHYEPRWRGGRWRGFSDGGTLQTLVEKLRDYILRGDQDFLRYLGPWPEWVCGGDLWGYGEEMQIVRDRVYSLVPTAQCAAPQTGAKEN